MRIKFKETKKTNKSKKENKNNKKILKKKFKFDLIAMMIIVLY